MSENNKTLDLTYMDAFVSTDSLQVLPSYNGVAVATADGVGTSTVLLSREDAEHMTRALAEYLGLEVKRPEPDVHMENAKFADIRVGDTVRRTITHPESGVVITTEGLVAEVTPQAAWTKEISCLAARGDDDDPRSSLTIVSRPVPELPTETGAIIQVHGDFEYLLNNYVTDNRPWRLLVKASESSFALAKGEMREQASARGFTVMTLTEKEQ